MISNFLEGEGFFPIVLIFCVSEILQFGEGQPKMGYSGINLTKYVHEFQNENFKPQMKEIHKYPSEWKD